MIPGNRVILARNMLLPTNHFVKQVHVFYAAREEKYVKKSECVLAKLRLAILLRCNRGACLSATNIQNGT